MLKYILCNNFEFLDKYFLELCKNNPLVSFPVLVFPYAFIEI